MKYCNYIYQTQRRASREVKVGNIGVGGKNPIRVQSMTTSDTRDIQATIEQIMRLADGGCEIARITVQGIKEAEACEGIKNGLLQKGYTIPLVADIHFYPPAAMRVIDSVDKVRINPGNFVDKRASFKTIDYDDVTYALELEKIEEKFTPLVEKCKKLKKAMRIGTNHGSLSDRIMNRYGDTARGMVESALEFTRVARKNDYHDLIFSMKASNTQVMIQAYRLLVAEMNDLGWDYPLHLGVTEAGEGEDGRIKSAIGIGSLLLDGLGDTIRVSLTEDPWLEIDPCQRLRNFAESYQGKGVSKFIETHRSLESKPRTPLNQEVALPLHRDGTVYLYVKEQDIAESTFFESLGCKIQFSKPIKDSGKIEAILLDQIPEEKKCQEKLQLLKNVEIAIISKDPQVLHFEHGYLLVDPKELSDSNQARTILQISNVEQWKNIEVLKPHLILFSPQDNPVHKSRLFYEWLKSNQLEIPVILQFSYTCGEEDLTIHASAEYGSLLCDGIGQGILVESAVDLNKRRSLSFGILQGARMRSSKTEFISCPGCGRTLFNLQKVAQRIRQRTEHLPGVKIAIMGCIVNGPGEMADADFGYVGSKPGKIDLYVGKQKVESDIDFDDADEKLVNLIKQHGRWIEPQLSY